MNGLHRNKYLDSLKPMEGTLTWKMWRDTVGSAFEPNKRWNMEIISSKSIPKDSLVVFNADWELRHKNVEEAVKAREIVIMTNIKG